MNRLLPALAASILLLACAHSQPANPNSDPIVGDWHGLGMMTAMRWVFRTDGTFLAGKDTGTWRPEADGKYLLFESRNPTNGVEATIGADGRLSIPRLRLVLVRAGGRQNTPPPDPKALLGTWRYAHTRQTLWLLAPAFDVAHFTDQGIVHSTSTLIARHTEGKYAANGNNLKISNQGPANAASNLTYRFEDDGKTLILMPPPPMTDLTVEWVFFRPDRFLPNSIAGKWQFTQQGLTHEIEILPDGRKKILMTGEMNGQPFRRDNSKEPAYTVLWQSQFGETATDVYIQPQLGLVSQMSKVARTSDSLTLTLIGWNEAAEMILEPGASQTWTRKTD